MPFNSSAKRPGPPSSIHRPADGRGEQDAIVPGMLTLLGIEDLARGLCDPPFHLDMSFRRPIPVGAAATARAYDEGAHGTQRWRVEVLFEGDGSAVDHITPRGTL